MRWLLLLIAIYAHSAFAQFTISGEFRPRSEYRHGFKSLIDENTDPALFVEQRTRLNLVYKTEKYSTKLVVQDIRTWGSQSQLVVEQGQLTGIHEAWVALQLSERSSLKSGRQEIILDDSRIFGNVGWAQQARSHDALLFTHSSSKSDLKIGVAFNQNSPQLIGTFYNVSGSYKTLQFLWYQIKLSDYSISLLGLNNGLQSGTIDDSRTYFSQTIGTRVMKSVGSFQPSGNIYYQAGKDVNGSKLSALEYALEIPVVVQENFNLKIGFEHLSGNAQNQTSSRNRSFTPFYGTNHKFNGLMDYFYVGNHMNSVGLNDLFSSITKKTGKWQIQLQGHIFNADEQVISSETSEELPKYLGTEFDLVLDYKPAKDVNLKIGYSQMFASKTMEELKGGSASTFTNWGWIMLTVKPTFFQSENKEE